MDSRSQKAELLVAEGRSFANVAKNYEVSGRVEDAWVNYLKASEKFTQAALESHSSDKELRFDLAKLFFRKGDGAERGY